MSVLSIHKRPGHTAVSWVLFLIAGLVFLLLCLKGGQWGWIGSHPGPLPGGTFVVLFVLTGLSCLLVFLLLPKGLPDRTAAWVIIGLSLLCRLALVPHEPSDDINRYLWEGKLVRQGISPYMHGPDDDSLARLAAGDPYHGSVNHPDLPSAYPPLALIIFSWIGAFQYSPMAVKLLMIVFDMGTIGFILRLLAIRQTDLRWAMLYALNPVVLYAFAGQSHLDVMQNFFLAGSLLFYNRKWWLPMYLFAGFAVQIKYMAAAAVPFLINKSNRRYAAAGLLAVLGPYLLFPETGLKQFFYSIIVFGEQYAFNGSIHGLLRGLTGDMEPATRICQILLTGCLTAGYIHFHPGLNRRYASDPIPGMFVAMGALLILAPTVHFWYLTWVILFLPFRPSIPWMLLCLTISLYFLTIGHAYHSGAWEMPVWAQIAEWLPFLLFLLRDMHLFFLRARTRLPDRPLTGISVVIPAKDEAGKIGPCIRAAQSDNRVREIIVADGGSRDQTVTLARQAGAVVVEHHALPEKGGGRGGQIYAGVKAATSDVIAVVHADVLASRPVYSTILAALNQDPSLVGGAVGGIFNQAGWRLRLIEFLNDARAVLTGISFGDQVQFFIKQPVMDRHLFPDIAIMEDVELSIRLKRLGRQTYLFGQALISPRRWKEKGFRNTVLILRLCALYLWKRSIGTPDTATMYSRYYGSQPPDRR